MKILLRFLAGIFESRGAGPESFSAGQWSDAYRLLPVLDGLDPDEKRRLEKLVMEFLRSKVFEGARGLEITPRMQLVIGLQACLPILQLGLDWYDGWTAVIVYPAGFAAERVYVDEFGIEHRVREELAGEAWERGPVVLSWEDAESAGREDGYNPVIHEFAHKLDMLNGEDNGFPPLHAGMDQSVWTAAFSFAYEDFVGRCERGENTGIDDYATLSPGEFFAVFSEAFFEQPDRLQQLYPQVYSQLKLFYRQDPHARLVKRADRH